MAPLLSEASSFALYDKGHQSFRSLTDLSQVSLPTVDLGGLLLANSPKQEIQKIAPQVLYFSLKNKA